MSDYVLKYSKGEEVKYISHLDFVRTFGRAVRRSGMQMSYSSGFNPHPIMSVALPLSVGVTSEGEYLRIRFEEDMSADYVKDTLNKAFPKGLEVLAAAKVEGKQMDFAKIDRARYVVDIETENGTEIPIEDFLNNKEILVMKKSKSGEKEADIRPYIYELKTDAVNGKIVTMSMCIAAGSKYNLKPDTVIAAMEKYIDGFKAEFFSIHRVCMLAEDKLYL